MGRYFSANLEPKYLFVHHWLHGTAGSSRNIKSNLNWKKHVFQYRYSIGHCCACWCFSIVLFYFANTISNHVLSLLLYLFPVMNLITSVLNPITPCRFFFCCCCSLDGNFMLNELRCSVKLASSLFGLPYPMKMYRMQTNYYLNDCKSKYVLNKKCRCSGKILVWYSPKQRTTQRGSWRQTWR